MEIFQVVHNLEGILGGTEIYTYSLCKQLSKNNEVFLIYRTNDKNKKEFDISIKRRDGINFIGINNTLKNINNFSNFYNNEFITQRFSQILDKFRPDLVHIQHLLFLSLSIVEEIKKRIIPIMFTLHDYWLICPNAKLLKYDLSICDGYKNCINCIPYLLYRNPKILFFYNVLKSLLPSYPLQQIKKFYFKMMRNYKTKKDIDYKIKQREVYIDRIVRWVDLFIAPSNFLREKMIMFGIPTEKMIFLPYGIDKSILNNLQKTESAKLRFGYLGNLNPAKGVDILIKAFNRIKSPNTELKIYGEGKGFEVYQKYLMKIAQNKNIKFLGPYNHENIAEILNGIDIIIVPSIWPENSPLVIHEAFATKVPVIASDIGGIPELVKNGINGLLFRPRDSENLYRKIKYICENSSIIEKFRENIPPIKSIEENAQEIEEIYRSLITNYSIEVKLNKMLNRVNTL